MSVEFYEEDNLSSIVPRAYTYQKGPRSKMVRILMKAGFKTERGANIFLICLALCALFFAGLVFWGMNRSNSGGPVTWDQIPQEVRDQLPQSVVNQIKNQ